MVKSKQLRKVRLDLAVTLDGFIEGKNGEIDWCIMETEMQFEKFLDQIDTIFFGRISYDQWRKLIPETEEEINFWNQIQNKKKYVFSRSRYESNDDAIWIHENLNEMVEKIKTESGKDIWLYGGANLITTFLQLDLIDEYRLSVHPIILGEGKALFSGTSQRRPLKLAESNPYPSGVVQLIYQREQS